LAFLIFAGFSAGVRNLGVTIAVVILTSKNGFHVVGRDANAAVVTPHRLQIGLGRFCFQSLQTDLLEPGFPYAPHHAFVTGQKWSKH